MGLVFVSRFMYIVAYAAIYCFEKLEGGNGYHDSTHSISRVWLFDFFGLFVHSNCFDVDQRVWRLIHSPATVSEQAELFGF